MPVARSASMTVLPGESSSVKLPMEEGHPSPCTDEASMISETRIFESEAPTSSAPSGDDSLGNACVDALLLSDVGACASRSSASTISEPAGSFLERPLALPCGVSAWPSPLCWREASNAASEVLDGASQLIAVADDAMRITSETAASTPAMALRRASFMVVPYLHLRRSEKRRNAAAHNPTMPMTMPAKATTGAPS